MIDKLQEAIAAVEFAQPHTEREGMSDDAQTREAIKYFEDRGGDNYVPISFVLSVLREKLSQPTTLAYRKDLEFLQARVSALEALLAECAEIARNGCLVPPDGGSPTDDERMMCENIANAILAKLKARTGEKWIP